MDSFPFLSGHPVAWFCSLTALGTRTNCTTHHRTVWLSPRHTEPRANNHHRPYRAACMWRSKKKKDCDCRRLSASTGDITVVLFGCWQCMRECEFLRVPFGVQKQSRATWISFLRGIISSLRLSFGKLVPYRVRTRLWCILVENQWFRRIPNDGSPPKKGEEA